MADFLYMYLEPLNLMWRTGAGIAGAFADAAPSAAAQVTARIVESATDGVEYVFA